MKKEEREILRNISMTTPITAFYLKGIESAKSVVNKFMKKPSFTEKLK